VSFFRDISHSAQLYIHPYVYILDKFPRHVSMFTHAQLQTLAISKQVTVTTCCSKSRLHEVMTKWGLTPQWPRTLLDWMANCDFIPFV